MAGKALGQRGYWDTADLTSGSRYHSLTCTGRHCAECFNVYLLSTGLVEDMQLV